MILPKIFTTLKTYNLEQFQRDLLAGVIVGVVALPLAIAFGIASGVTPERGLYTAILAGFLISALGGSRVQIGGPTGAFVVIIYGIVEKYGLEGLFAATFMAGVILVILGLARLGGVIKFIPFPVITGFTSGIAVIIALGQVKDFLGLEMGAVPADLVAKVTSYREHLRTFNPYALAVALFSLLILVWWPKVNRRIPSPLVALLAATAAAQLLHLPIETIGSRFGQIHANFPAPQIPSVSFQVITSLAGPAFSIAILAAVESLLSAVVADGMIGSRHRSNMELVAQGIANMVSPIFGGLPATGAIARTATNIKNGGRTPVAGIVHAVTLLLITLFFGRWVALVPMACLAAILVLVAYHMSEWRSFRSEFRAPKGDLAVLLVTFLLTVFVDLTVAIEVGMVLASFLFMARMAEVTNVSAVTRELDRENGDKYEDDPNSVRRRAIPKGVEVFEIDGPFFFGAAEQFRDTLGQVSGRPKVLIIRMRNVPSIDSTGLHVLADLSKRARHDGALLVLSDVHTQPLMALGRSDILDLIGEDNLTGNLDDALNRAREFMGLETVPPPEGAEPTVFRERKDGGP